MAPLPRLVQGEIGHPFVPGWIRPWVKPATRSDPKAATHPFKPSAEKTRAVGCARAADCAALLGRISCRPRVEIEGGRTFRGQRQAGQPIVGNVSAEVGFKPIRFRPSMFAIHSSGWDAPGRSKIEEAGSGIREIMHHTQFPDRHLRHIVVQDGIGDPGIRSVHDFRGNWGAGSDGSVGRAEGCFGGRKHRRLLPDS